jgi:predicted ferric reductase
MNQTKSLPATTRVIMGTTIVLLALLLLAGGWTIPFHYESFSILYKFGIEKTYLRSGKMVGITIALLVFFQILLASRFIIFERIFSVKAELQLHRINGMIIAFLAVVHPLLVKASENFTLYTFEKKYYPEFLGIGLFCLILLLSVTAVFRPSLKITYTRWLLLHRLGATLVLVIMPTHVLWVSETFKSGMPRTAALMTFTLALLLAVRVWLRKLTAKTK